MSGKSSAFAAALLVALGVTAYGGGLRLDPLSNIDEQTRSAVTRGVEDSRVGRLDIAWRHIGLEELRTTPHTESRGRCAQRSFGQVRTFFERTPCRHLTRQMIFGSDKHGNVAAVSLAWVRMGTERDARRVKLLDDRFGTGDIHAPGHQLLANDGIRFHGTHYASHRDRTLFVRAEATSASGTVPAETLTSAAAIAARLPLP